MNQKSTILLLVVVAVISFLGGRWSTLKPNDDDQVHQANVSDNTRSNPTKRSRENNNFDSGRSSRQAAAAGQNLTEEQCLKLSTEERLNLVKKGALIFDGLKQAAYLEGVIKTLNKNELENALKILGKAQDRGNWPAQEVWNNLWKQAGRLNPKETLSQLTHKHTRSDARFIMEGWFEIDPVAAMAWAQSPKKSSHDAAAAAYALTRNANGDPKKLLATLSDLPADDLVLKDCLQDYFDIADITGTSEGTTAIYDELPVPLKRQAWTVTMRRLSYTDAQEAIDWLGDHVKDPGADYSQTQRLFQELAIENPSKITAWAATLPSLKEGETHPAEMTYEMWRRVDRVAATAWLKSIENPAAWAQRLRSRIPLPLDQWRR